MPAFREIARARLGGLLLATFVMTSGVSAIAAPPNVRVPPSWEIEVLDPNAHSKGRPTVELVPSGKNGDLEVNIPPVVLVHKYYYSGNRSFQAQPLPGGPSIVVANHPKNGQRKYIEVTLPPGAPRVTYTGHSIDYDYGDQGVTIQFPPFGWKPKIHYRNGKSIVKSVAAFTGADKLSGHAQKLAQGAKGLGQRSSTMVVGVWAEAVDATKTLVLPAQNLLEMMPLGKTLFAGDLEQRLSESADKYRRDVANKKAEQQKKRDNQFRRTLR